MKARRLGIVGATGVVGREMLSLLHELDGGLPEDGGDMPWYPPSSWMCPSLPEWARATRRAAITASVPEMEKRTSSAAGTILQMRSATVSSRSVASAKTPPTSMPSRAAASTRGSA